MFFQGKKHVFTKKKHFQKKKRKVFNCCFYQYSERVKTNLFKISQPWKRKSTNKYVTATHSTILSIMEYFYIPVNVSQRLGLLFSVSFSETSKNFGSIAARIAFADTPYVRTPFRESVRCTYSYRGYRISTEINLNSTTYGIKTKYRLKFNRVNSVVIERQLRRNDAIFLRCSRNIFIVLTEYDVRKVFCSALISLYLYSTGYSEYIKEKNQLLTRPYLGQALYTLFRRTKIND